jgi:hypothetical protein
LLNFESEELKFEIASRIRVGVVHEKNPSELGISYQDKFGLDELT